MTTLITLVFYYYDHSLSCIKLRQESSKNDVLLYTDQSWQTIHSKEPDLKRDIEKQ